MIPTLFSNILFWYLVLAFIFAWEHEKKRRNI